MPSGSLVLQGLVHGVLTGGVYALMASGLTLSFGIMRIVQLSHAAFIVLAAYLTYASFHWLGGYPLVAIVFVAPAFFLVGRVVHRHLLSRAGEQNPFMSVLATVGLAMIVEGLLGVVATGNHRTLEVEWAHRTVQVLGASLPIGRIVAAGIAIVTMGLLVAVLYRTGFGRALRATIENRDAARLVGIDVAAISASGFGLALATTAAGGACLALMTTFHPALHWSWLARLLAIVVIGGLGSLAGAAVAAIGMGVVEAVLAVTIDPTWAVMAFYLALLVVLVARPGGVVDPRSIVRRV